MCACIWLNIFKTNLSLAAYSTSMAHLSRTNAPYLSKNSIPLCVCCARLSYWSCKLKKKENELTIYNLIFWCMIILNHIPHTHYICKEIPEYYISMIMSNCHRTIFCVFMYPFLTPYMLGFLFPSTCAFY